MTDAVADHVLYGSYAQAQAISISLTQAASMVDVHPRLIRRLEQVTGLDRELSICPARTRSPSARQAQQGLVGAGLAT